MPQRIPGVDPEKIEARISSVLNAQAKKWGGPLINHLVYARIPSVFKAVRGMWSGLGEATSTSLLDESLIVLINRRVAILNQCPF